MDERKLTDVIDIPESFGKVEEAPAAPDPQPDSQPRDDNGRFASRSEPEAPKPQEPTGATPEPTPPVAQPVRPDPGFVPLAAVLDAREKLAEERRIRQEIEAKLHVFERQKAEPPPDFFADPDAAFEARFNSRLGEMLSPLQQQLVQTQTALIEERLARVAGPEKASKIEAELQKAAEEGDPSLSYLANALKSQGPAAVKAVVDWYDKRTFDPVSMREQIRAEILAEMQQQKPAVPAHAAPVTPPSMAAVASGGAPARDVEVTPQGKFEQMFNR